MVDLTTSTIFDLRTSSVTRSVAIAMYEDYRIDNKVWKSVPPSDPLAKAMSDAADASRGVPNKSFAMAYEIITKNDYLVMSDFLEGIGELLYPQLESLCG